MQKISLSWFSGWLESHSKMMKDSLQGFLMFWNTWRLGRYWEWWWVPNSTVLMESTTAKHHKCLVTSGRSCCSYEEVHFFHQYHTNILLKIAVFQLSQLVRQIWSTDDTTPRHLHRWHLGMTGLSSLGAEFLSLLPSTNRHWSLPFRATQGQRDL